MRTDWRKLLALAGLVLALIGLAAPAMAERVTITGEVTYRERLALPPDAILGVRLLDVSLMDVAAVVHAEARIEGSGQVPLTFTLGFDDDLIEPGHTYALVAEIMTEDTIWFRNTTRFAIDPLAPALPILILVQLVNEPILHEPEPVDEAEILPVPVADPAIFDTIWRLNELAGIAAIGGVDVTLSIAQDRRAGGSSGCNNYFTEAVLLDHELDFGPIASTKMACDPIIMAQEQAFFDVLEDTAFYRIDGATLLLMDEFGEDMARLSH